jgi:hypothetical protein
VPAGQDRLVTKSWTQFVLVQAEMVKRQEREEDEGIAVAVRDLESAVQKGSADAKVKVCHRGKSR